MRFAGPAIFICCLVGLGHILKHYWGRAAQLWLLGTLLFLWFLAWVIAKMLARRLRVRGIEMPEDDG
jgi:hypothetical protein